MKELEIFSIISMSLYFLLGSFLVSDKAARKKGFTWIGLFFLFLGLNSLDATFSFNGVYFSHPYLMLWEEPFILLYGPLIYFFGKSLQSPQFQFKSGYLLHFVPFIGLEILVIIFHANFDRTTKVEVLTTITNSQLSVVTMAGFLPVFFHFFVYAVVAKRGLLRHQDELKKIHSSLEVMWSKEIINLLLIVFIVSLLSSAFRLTSSTVVQISALLIVLATSILIAARIILKALRQPIFREETIREQVFKLTDGEINRLIPKIEQLLTKEKLYTNPKLTLKGLADTLGESERSVSYVINSDLAENFYDYINQHRIEAAKKILIDHNDANITILEVMYQVGFNSKSSFNTQFKEKTGYTPSAYKKLMKKN